MWEGENYLRSENALKKYFTFGKDLVHSKDIVGWV